MHRQPTYVWMFGIENIIEFVGAAGHGRDTEHRTFTLRQPTIANSAARDIVSRVPSPHATRADFEDRHPLGNIDNETMEFDLEVEAACVRQDLEQRPCIAPRRINGETPRRIPARPEARGTSAVEKRMDGARHPVHREDRRYPSRDAG
jgi:hypothetical protein